MVLMKYFKHSRHQVISMESALVEQIVTGEVAPDMAAGQREAPWVGMCSSDQKQPVSRRRLSANGQELELPPIHVLLPLLSINKYNAVQPHPIIYLRSLAIVFI